MKMKNKHMVMSFVFFFGSQYCEGKSVDATESIRTCLFTCEGKTHNIASMARQVQKDKEFIELQLVPLTNIVNKFKDDILNEVNTRSSVFENKIEILEKKLGEEEQKSIKLQTMLESMQRLLNLTHSNIRETDTTTTKPLTPDVECEMPDKPEYGSVELVGDKARVGRIAVFTCDEGRHLIGSGTSQCLKTGEWSFPAPECVEPCTIPAIPNGQLGIYEIAYSRSSRTWVREFKQVYANIAIYEGNQLTLKCNRDYVLKGHPRWEELQITCLSGKLSPPPECVTIFQEEAGLSGRCYLKDLPAKDGVAMTDNELVDSNEKANILCLKGYSLTYPDVYCRNGAWKTQNALSPCKEDDCEVKSVKNGEMMKAETTPITNFWGQQTGTKTEYVLANIGSFESTGSSLFVQCRSPYRFQGEYQSRFVEIACRRGEWSPFPVCLLRLSGPEGDRGLTGIPGIQGDVGPPGTPGPQGSNSFGTRAPEVQEGTIKPSSTDGITKYPTDNFQTFTEATRNGNLEISPPNLLLVKSTDNISVCSCRYALQDSILIGYDGDKKLGFNDVVKSGSTVTFHCNDPGHFILRGEQNVSCPPGCQWHSSLYPSCHVRTDYDIAIKVRADPAENLAVLAGGIYTVKTGTHLNVQCQTSGGYLTQLEFKGPNTDVHPTEDSDYPYILSFHVHRASSIISGEYSCTDIQRLSANNFQHSVTIEVKDIQCPEIASEEPLNVAFTDNRNVNSVASFQCSYPYKRYGLSQATCEASGRWSEPTPSCRMPTCTLAAVHDSFPAGVEIVVPNIELIEEENIPYGSTMYLLCDGTGLVLEGNSIAVCNEHGTWTVDKNMQCVKGCPKVQTKKDSRLRMYLDKETYKIGESLIFSCPRGMRLTPDVQRIMCISRGWTPNIVPECQ